MKNIMQYDKETLAVKKFSLFQFYWSSYILGLLSGLVFLLITSTGILTNNVVAIPQLNEDSRTTSIDCHIVTATTYQASKRQTDDSPFLTSALFKINKTDPFKNRFIAVSRDLLKKYNYGEIVQIENAGHLNGYYIVADCMNKRYKNRIDILINNSQKPTTFHNVKVKKANY